MYSSIYRVQSSTRRLPIRALFGFTLKLVKSYSSLSPQSLRVVVCPWCQPWVASLLLIVHWRKHHKVIDVDYAHIRHIVEDFIHHLLEWAGKLQRPKYIMKGSKDPLCVVNAAFHSSPSRIRTLLYPHRRSIFVKSLQPFNLSTSCEISGSG